MLETNPDNQNKDSIELQTQKRLFYEDQQPSSEFPAIVDITPEPRFLK